MNHSASEGTAFRAGPNRLERAFVIIILLLSLGAFQNLSVTGQIDSQNMGMVGMQILWSALYLVVISTYFKVCKEPGKIIARVMPILAVSVFAFTSILWSQEWQLSARRSIALFFSLVFGVYLAYRFAVREQLRLLATVFAICIVFSFFFELLNLNPSEGIAGWYGVFYLKTQLGANMALGALVYLSWKKIEPEKAHIAKLGLMGSLLLVALSRDVTSLLTVVALLVGLPYLSWVFRRRLVTALAAIGCALASGTLFIFYVVKHLQLVTGLVGKDPMLTGRVPLWVLATVMAMQRPWFGYGYDAFWLPGTIYVRRIWQILRWMPPHAHNGLLELWLELGLVGVGLFLMGFGYYFFCAIRQLRSDHSAVAAWPLAFLLFLFLSNLTESHFIVANNVYFVLYVAVAATLVSNHRSLCSGPVSRIDPEHV